MSKLTLMILSVIVVFSPTAMLEPTKINCVAQLVSRIDIYMKNISSTQRRASKIIDDYIDKLTYNKSYFWDKPQKKYRYGPPELKFDENCESCEIIDSRLVDDRACIKYSQKFTEQQIRKCSDAMYYSMCADKEEIQDLASKAMEYLEIVRLEHSVLDDEEQMRFDEEYCSDKFKRPKNVTKIGEMWISDILFRVEQRMSHFAKHIGYCLMTQGEISRSSFDQWYNGCSYYTKL